MSKNYKIEPEFVITLIVDFNGISIATTKEQTIYDLFFIPIISVNKKLEEQELKQKILYKIDELLYKYNINTIIMERNKLFTDKMDKYPDPYILSDILLKYSIQITLEDNYINKIKYFMQLPDWEWVPTILNKKSRYAIDLYKNHILSKGFNGDDILKQKLDSGNFFKVLCLSECSLYDKLMNKKFQINYTSEDEK